MASFLRPLSDGHSPTSSTTDGFTPSSQVEMEEGGGKEAGRPRTY